MNLVVDGLAAVKQCGVGALVLARLNQIIHGRRQDFPVLQTDFEFNVEDFLADSDVIFARLVLGDLDPVVRGVRDGRAHPLGRQLYSRLQWRNVLHQERGNLVRGVELLEREIKVDRAFPEDHVASVGPGGRDADLDIGMGPRPLQVTLLDRQPQIGVEGEHVGDWTNQERLNQAEIRYRRRIRWIKRERLAKAEARSRQRHAGVRLEIGPAILFHEVSARVFLYDALPWTS